jgi:hypothetical protein
MEETNQDDWLDRQLREATPYIDDAGFTTRVMQQLPKRRKARQSLRAGILLVTTILASALSFLLSGNGRFVTVGLGQIASLPMLWVFALAASCGLLVTGIGLIAAISKSRELQSY